MSNAFVTVFNNLQKKIIIINKAVHCVFMLVYSAFTNVNKHNL